MALIYWRINIRSIAVAFPSVFGDSLGWGSFSRNGVLLLLRQEFRKALFWLTRVPESTKAGFLYLA
jgi:hypothetical protein